MKQAGLFPMFAFLFGVSWLCLLLPSCTRKQENPQPQISAAAKAFLLTPPEKNPPVFRLMAGPRSAFFVVLGERGRELEFRVSPLKGEKGKPAQSDLALPRVRTEKIEPMRGEKDLLHRVLVDHLSPGEWELVIARKGGGSQSESRKRFHVRPETAGAPVSFAVLSGLGGVNASHGMLEGVAQSLAQHAETLDFVVFAGNALLLEEKTLPAQNRPPWQVTDVWQTYVDSWKRNPFGHQETLVPLVFVWNDTETGQAFSEGSNAVVPEVLRVFSHFHLPAPLRDVLETGPGAGSFFKVRKQNFLFLDGRSWRLANAPEDPFARWGREQLETTLQRLHQAPGPTWVFDGSPFFAESGDEEALEKEHPAQFEHLFRRLAGLSFPLAFASGHRLQSRAALRSLSGGRQLPVVEVGPLGKGAPFVMVQSEQVGAKDFQLEVRWQEPGKADAQKWTYDSRKMRP